jgi:hypothetical protein
VEQKSSYVLRLAEMILGLTLIVSLIVVIIGIVYRWERPVQFSNGFFFAACSV